MRREPEERDPGQPSLVLDRGHEPSADAGAADVTRDGDTLHLRTVAGVRRATAHEHGHAEDTVHSPRGDEDALAGAETTRLPYPLVLQLAEADWLEVPQRHP